MTKSNQPFRRISTLFAALASDERTRVVIEGYTRAIIATTAFITIPVFSIWLLSLGTTVGLLGSAALMIAHVFVSATMLVIIPKVQFPEIAIMGTWAALLGLGAAVSANSLSADILRAIASAQPKISIQTALAVLESLYFIYALYQIIRACGSISTRPSKTR